MTRRPRPLVLCILDGWGERDDGADNAIERASTPVWHALTRRWPHSRLDASEHYVGLPDGQMGNSEVGHTNLGAGRVVMQDLPRIDQAIADGIAGAHCPALRGVHRKAEGERRHARMSSGCCRRAACIRIRTRSRRWPRSSARPGFRSRCTRFLDGRDTPPKSAVGYLKKFQEDIAGHGDVRDRDDRRPLLRDGPRQALGPRCEGLRVLTDGEGEHADDPIRAVEAAYARGETDEFVLPTAIGGWRGMQDGDGVLFANFRADRMREIAGALLDPEFRRLRAAASRQIRGGGRAWSSIRPS